MASSRQNNLNNITVLNITNTNRSHLRFFVVIIGNPSKTKHSLMISMPFWLARTYNVAKTTRQSFNVMACHGPWRVTLQNSKIKRARNLQCCKTLHQRREVPKPITLARLKSLAAPRVITEAFTYIMRTCANASRESVVTAPCLVRMRACRARGGCNRLSR